MARGAHRQTNHRGDDDGAAGTMKPLVSVLINNFNYGKYLPLAIDSALSQSYHPIEVIVVDDGSSDGSHRIISLYEPHVVPVLKENGGQASAFNAGVARSAGQIMCFLDSDDYFAPTKVEEVVEVFAREGVDRKPMMVHHPVELRDDITGEMTGQRFGKTHASPYNGYWFARKYRFIEYVAGPTSGISINRPLADLLFPLPEPVIRVSADDLVVKAATLVGKVYSLDRLLASYRLHSGNAWYSSSRRPSREFFQCLDAYLNQKLVESGLSPVMSVYDSMECWSWLVLDRQWLALGRHMTRLMLAQRDLLTLAYAFGTGKFILRQLKNYAFGSLRSRLSLRAPRSNV
jgi:glycosyltransferase involved in cell wall biosynthesis